MKLQTKAAVSDGATNKGDGGGCRVSLRRQTASCACAWGWVERGRGGTSFELGHISWFY